MPCIKLERAPNFIFLKEKSFLRNLVLKLHLEPERRVAKAAPPSRLFALNVFLSVLPLRLPPASSPPRPADRSQYFDGRRSKDLPVKITNLAAPG